ncbi:MAG: hypothetical protein JJT78_06350 [Leptospira sp.]|nr:hypothetical protein [Leptospira sp.]
MILSRIFSVSFGFFILLSALAYALIDTRPIREQAYETNSKHRYEKTIQLYDGERFLEEEDYALLALAVSGLEKEINLESDQSKKIKLADRLKNLYDIGFDVYMTNDSNCIHLDDLYISHIRKHAYYYQKVILSRANASYNCNPPQQNSEYLNRIMLEDPKNFIEETSQILIHLFQTSLDPIGELELNFFRENMHYLATQDKSKFYKEIYQVTGNNVNFRNGPGVENSIIGQLHVGSELFCFDKDQNEETIGGKFGKWMHCFSTEIFKSGWIFSGQITGANPDANLIQEGRRRFSNLEFFTQIDFDNWNERFIPLHFHGDYIPTKKVIHKNEIGFTLYRPEDGKTELICRKFSGRKNFLEIFYQVESTDLPVPIAELHVIKSGISYPAFRLAAMKGSIVLNGNRFVIDHPATREILAMKILPSEAGYVSGTIIHKNKGIVENLQSLPLDPKLFIGSSFSWEICIPQAIQRSNDTAILYGFRIGREF